MWKNLGWVAIGAVLLAFILKKDSDGKGPSFDALNRTIEDLETA